MSRSSRRPSPAGRIDVHTHYVTPRYRREAEAAGHTRPDGFPGLPDWDAATAVETMDRLGIATAMLSISSPGVHFGDDAAARALARHVNEAGAEAADAHPGRFGLFASLPLPDLDGALAELEHALDELGADGVVLETNHHGVYLGDPGLDPLFAELDRRRAVVFIHPTSPACWEHTALGYPRPMIEFLFDTTRAVTHLVLGGARRRFPHVEVIVPHAGAALPVLADRIGGLVEMVPGLGDVATTEELLEALRGFWYDVTGFATPRHLAALRQLVEPDRMLYGSDWPFSPEALVRTLAERLEADGTLSAEERRAVERENALRLFPRLVDG